MEPVNPDNKLIQYINKLSKYELYIILKDCEEFINQIKKEDKAHLEKMEKDLR